jgi:BirA family transcriptional regulator, biotin operon repressor / biotin---[acetyl-CoA-carboxylase] ligase
VAVPVHETRGFSRVAHADRVGSTNDVVRGWLAAGEPEICLATAGEQTAGRGRLGRTWVAPPGAALLASLGFRPTWLAPDRTWRLAATVALAMIDAGEEVAGLREGAIRLKWPNDLVIERSGPDASLADEHDVTAALARLTAPIELRKLAGILGESDRLGTEDPAVVVGIGMNADWAAAEFPPALAGSMTSLREASGGRPIDTGDLLAAFQDHVLSRITALRAGYFDLATWSARQVTTGRLVVLDGATSAAGPASSESPAATADRRRPGDPAAGATVRVLAVDAATGALVVEDPASPEGERLVHAGEVRHVRLAAGQV